jgi:hypothetical protein
MSNENDIKLQKIAQRIIDNIEHDPQDNNFGFVVTVLIIISIVLTLIRVIQECNKPIVSFDKRRKCEYFKSEIQNRSFKKTWFTKRLMKKAIRQTIGTENYNVYGIAIMNAIFKAGETITDDESFTLVEAANV